METTTQTIAEFLLARIAEDEEQAHAATNMPDRYGRFFLASAEYPHIEVSASRVLAECEAKRRIAEDCLNYGSPTLVHEFDDILRVMASVYSNHPDYAADWKPWLHDEDE